MQNANELSTSLKRDIEAPEVGLQARLAGPRVLA